MSAPGSTWVSRTRLRMDSVRRRRRNRVMGYSMRLFYLALKRGHLVVLLRRGRRQKHPERVNSERSSSDGLDDGQKCRDERQHARPGHPAVECDAGGEAENGTPNDNDRDERRKPGHLVEGELAE